MRYGFEGIFAVNTAGDPRTPVWTPVDIANDFSADDDSDEIDATRRSAAGRKVGARSLLSRAFSFAIEGSRTAVGSTPSAMLLAASRSRQGVVDVCAFDDATLADDGTVAAGRGVRMAALVKLTDQQPLGDRWLHEFELKPGKKPSGEAWADFASLDLDFEIGEIPDGSVTSEDGDSLVTEDDDYLVLEG